MGRATPDNVGASLSLRIRAPTDGPAWRPGRPPNSAESSVTEKQYNLSLASLAAGKHRRFILGVPAFKFHQHWS
jgi:hypothetical protein